MDHNSKFLDNMSSQLNFSVHIENIRVCNNSVFRTCGNRQCGLCCVFNLESSFKSTTTNRTYRTKLPEDIKLVD